MNTVCDVVGEVYNDKLDNLDLFTVKAQNIKRSVAAARQFTHYVMHHILGFSATFSAKTTNMTRNTVFRNNKKVRDLLLADKQYRIINEKLLKIFNNNE